jgi:hypothetical protein
MPSGFQQDANQLSPDFYRVVLTLSGGTGTYTAAAPANGAVNPYNWDAFATLPSSDANAERLSRGNLRWQAIIEEVSKHSDAQVIDVEVTSADNTDANSVPTAVAFTIKYDRDSFLLDYNTAGVVTGNPDGVTTFTPTTGGAVTIDTVAKAIRYLVGQGILRGGTDGYTKKYATYDFTNTSGKVSTITIQRPDTDGDVYDDITVTLVDGTELTSVV